MSSVTVIRFDLLHLKMRLKRPFRTSFGTVHDRHVTLVRAVTAEGGTGYGELVAEELPLYSEETVGTAVLMIKEILAPRLIGKTFAHPRDIHASWGHLRRNHMAKAALELACWDAWCKNAGVPLAVALGGEKERVPAGVSIGIQPTVADLAGEIERFLAQGYQRIKIKIQPGWDVDVVAAIRRHFGDIPLMVDANSAYRSEDIGLLRRLDEHGLMMIEQPLDEGDLADHAALQRQIRTPICLDESILSADDARRAAQLGACKIINIKVGRVGGHAPSIALHDMACHHGMPVWCGGMLESGIGRLHNIALAALRGFVLPGDTSASDRYWEEDIIDPPVSLNGDGTVTVPADPGIGAAIRGDLLGRLMVGQESVP